MAKSTKQQPPDAQPSFDPAAIDAIIGDTKTPAELEALFRAMKRVVVERMLNAELTHHLGYERGDPKPVGQPNHRNGSTPKTVLTDDDVLELAVPRDRAGTFEPQLVPKNARRLPGFDAKVISLYARGMTVREIQGHLEELYQIDIAPDLISTVTDAVLEEVALWQQRPLDACYPVVFFDCLRVKIRDEGAVRSKAVYLALGIRSDGSKDILGMWVEQTEGAAFWHRVMTELTNRGVADILIACVDGLAGFPAAITTVFPQTQVHQCVVHLVRQSLAVVPWKDRKAVAKELRAIYRAPTEAAAVTALTAFEATAWGDRFPTIGPLWRRHWEFVSPAFLFPIPVRRLLSTTNAIESLHMQLRKIIKTRGHFPTDEAATKLLYLALRNIMTKWQQRATTDWTGALPHLAILFGARFIHVTD